VVAYQARLVSFKIAGGCSIAQPRVNPSWLFASSPLCVQANSEPRFSSALCLFGSSPVCVQANQRAPCTPTTSRTARASSACSMSSSSGPLRSSSASAPAPLRSSSTWPSRTSEGSSSASSGATSETDRESLIPCPPLLITGPCSAVVILPLHRGLPCLQLPRDVHLSALASTSSAPWLWPSLPGNPEATELHRM